MVQSKARELPILYSVFKRFISDEKEYFNNFDLIYFLNSICSDFFQAFPKRKFTISFNKSSNSDAFDPGTVLEGFTL